jgi:diphthine methyl ester acylhydrolase
LEADVGGGAWRVKWHPSPSRGRDLLVACMHDGFKTLRFGDALGGDQSWEVMKRFDEHQSLAYGVDWSFGASEGNGDTLIGSCSFYDHTMNVWWG